MPKGSHFEDGPGVVTLGCVGGAAGNLTLTGIATDDTILSVISISFVGSQSGTCAAIADLTSEFTIAAADTIDNTSGTATTNMAVLVQFADADA